MLKLFKRLIGKESVKEEVSFNNLGEWVENKLKESNLSKELSELFNEIGRSSTILAVSVKRIAHKVVREDLPSENINTIEEYRDDFVSKMQTFLKQINLEKKDPDSILNYCENLSAALEQIKESTQNHFSILEKFFSEESADVTEALDALAVSKSKLNKLVKDDGGVKYIGDVMKLIHLIRKKNKLLFDLKDQIERDAIKKKEAEQYKLALETDLDNLKTAEEYVKYDELLSKKLKLEKEMERETQNMSILFSPVIKTLVEYDKKELGADRALARQYASNPIESLHNDKQLWILNVLQSISDKLQEMEENEQKRIKLRQSIMALNETVLKDYLSKQNLIKEAMNQIKKQLLSNNTATKIGDISYKMKHADEQLKVCDENRKKREEEISQLNAEKDLLMLEKKLSLLGKVKII